MNLRRKKTVAQPGRQRRQASNDWHPTAAFSYHEQRDVRQENPGRQNNSAIDSRRHMLSSQYWLQRSGMVLAVIAAIICLVSVLSVSSQPRIVFLDSAGSNRAFHSANDYQQSAAKQLASSPWNRNKVTFDSGAAANKLQAQYPELAQVTIALPLIGHRPVYYLRANAPAFILESVSGNYVLDSAGTALLNKDAAPQSATDNLPVITDQTGVKVQLGKQIISSSDTQFIETVSQTLAAKQVTVASMTLPAGSVEELDVHVAGKAYSIKFNMHDGAGARQQVGTYLATIQQLSAKGTVPVQYIDVRVSGRAYYQ